MTVGGISATGGAGANASNGPATSGAPAALGQKRYAVDALAVQMNIAIMEAQKEEAAYAQQPSVTDPTIVEQRARSFSDFLNETRLGAIDTFESFAERLSQRLQEAPEGFANVNKLLNYLPSNIAVNAMVDEFQAENPEDFSNLSSKLNKFLERQVTAVENGEVSPEAAGLGVTAALVAAYKLAPKAALTHVVKSLAGPISDVFAAARSRLSHSKVNPEVLARFRVLDSQGHAIKRHGPDVTEKMMADRVLKGIDPMTGTTVDGRTGQPHIAPKNATAPFTNSIQAPSQT